MREAGNTGVLVGRLHVRNKPDKERLGDQRMMAGCTRCEHVESMT
mgnify:CR=1 FL=1